MTPIVKRFAVVVAFLAATDLAVLLDIPVLRQLLGFSFFTFVPGILILYLLRLGRLGLTEKVVLSVGLSVSFLMLYGLFVNSASLLVGYDTPLSTVPVVVSFSLAVLVMGAVACASNRTASFAGLSGLRLSTQEKAYLLLPALFPLLSILGTRLMNVSHNNSVLMVLLFVIPVYVVFVAARHNRITHRVYPLLILFIGVSLMLMFSLRCNHIMGGDTHKEYYLFQTTSANLHWSIVGCGNLDACLSISLLPSIYQSLLKMDPELLFKLLYSLIVSILPLIVYVVSKKHIGVFYAFLASFFFASQVMFLWTPAQARSNIAVLFFSLTIMALLDPKIKESTKIPLFLIFSASTIVSHYSTSYIFLFILLLALVGVWIARKVFVSRSKHILPRPEDHFLPEVRQYGVSRTALPGMKYHISGSLVALFFLMLFLWYSQLTRAPFESGVEFIQHTLVNLRDFFLLEARGGVVQSAIGEGIASRAIPRKVEFVISWVVVFLIAIGVFTLVRRLRDTVSTPNSRSERLDLLPAELDSEFLILSLGCCAVLVSSVALPFVSIGYSLSRTQFQAMVLLSTFLIIGGMTAAKSVRLRQRFATILILAVIVPYFLCTTGAMSQVFAFPSTVTLNSEGPAYDALYVHDQETNAAKWIESNRDRDSTIYTDREGFLVLLSAGGIPFSKTDNRLVPVSERGGIIDGLIYLRYRNVVKGELIGTNRDSIYDISYIATMLDPKDKIYAT
ncbi:MAG: hypothetical protein DRI39_10745, partial [Chloroflexi bacterium]